MTKIDGLYHKLDTFMTSGPHHHYPTQSYSYEASYPELVEDQNFLRPSYTNHYSDTSDLGWASNPNFLWSNGSHLGGPTDFIHHSALSPQYPQLFEQPHKPSLEDTLQTFIQSTMQFQQATQSTLQANTQAIKKLEVQLGQLATLIYENNEEKILNQLIADSIGQLEIEASSHNEQADSITTLGNDKLIDIHIC